jgi:RNase P subunit RPR2
MSTKKRDICPACGYDLVIVCGDEEYIAKTGRSMVKVNFGCNECGYEWSESLNLEQYAHLKLKGLL